MKAVSAPALRLTAPEAPPLRHGERLSQAEFHRRYQACAEDFKAELIGGVVYVASPLGRPHGVYHPELAAALVQFKAGTPGVEVLDNATTILGDFSEPQPDLALRVLQEYGGRSRVNEGQYIEGAPELIAEIAHSSRDIDLGEKREDYEKAGVLEYLVLAVAEQELHWFHFRLGKQVKPDRKNIARSRVFPGLWIDTAALWARDSARLLATVQEGLRSRAHATFVRRLQSARRKLS